MKMCPGTSTAEDVAVQQITLRRWSHSYHACHFNGYKGGVGGSEEEFSDRESHTRAGCGREGTGRGWDRWVSCCL